MSSNNQLFEHIKLRKYILGISFIWLFVILISIIWNLNSLSNNIIEITKADARASFNKDTAIRMWATKHGEVYVPLTKHTPANTYLAHIKDRNITKPNGDTLTLMNPAYMIRQMFNDFPQKYGTVGSIVSLKPLNPNNAPDEWEKKALQGFEYGENERIEIFNINGKNFLKLMQPMQTQNGCLKCHGHQGYKVGDIRGGVGVSVPMQKYEEYSDKERNTIILFHGLILVLGFVGIGFGATQLNKEIIKREKVQIELKNSEIFSATLLNSTPDLIYLYDIIEHKNIYSNDGIKKILGYSVKEVQDMGEEVLPNLMHPEDFNNYLKTILPAYDKIDDNMLIENNYRIKCKNGSWNWVHSKESIFKRLENGKPKIIFGIVSDITEQKKINEKIKKSEENLKNSLNEKELLIKEIHHRVKNNMQIVVSLLNLQANSSTDKRVSLALIEGKNRIETMSLIHQTLYQTDNLTIINHEDYITKLIQNTTRSFGSIDKKIEYNLTIEKLDLSVNETIIIALIINELLTNAFKHAFPNNDKGKIEIIFQNLENGQILLKFSDNGIGIPEEIFTSNFETLGMQLIYDLAEDQLKGKIEIDRTNGTCFNIVFNRKTKLA
ncbi:MAG: hypothetical protein COW71_08295 [Ignavibacteriales bacterium CG18_big_fil_WC_8_21_14_2_50_31_20]|nr:MAG: hypothetical protein COW71_08295 [Ignavibacteriales bacterium CG18_big_fil_WC_8_21_14_2_50_31_20]